MKAKESTFQNSNSDGRRSEIGFTELKVSREHHEGAGIRV